MTEVAKTCPEGKYLNVLTGRCNNNPTTTTKAACKEGYYRNPLTGRCKKNEEPKAEKTCDEGYELNPETNRCRKIRASNMSAYPVEEIPQETHNDPKIFIAVGALVLLGIAAIVYVVIQFRKEIWKFITGLFRRNAKL